MKHIGNSPLFYKRYRHLQSSKNRTPRVPRRYKGEPPQHHSDLFTDENPKGTVHNLRFRSKKEAEESVRRLEKLYRSGKIAYAHLRQIGTTMEQRSRFHAHPSPGIRAGHRVWKRWNRSFTRKNYYRSSKKMAKHTATRKRSHRRKLRTRYDEPEDDMMSDDDNSMNDSYNYEDDESEPMDTSLTLYHRKRSGKASRKMKKSTRSRNGSKKTRRTRRASKKSRRKSKRSRKH